VIIALAGNPNCGKTTLFNRLTGQNAHTGNFPGVTVEKRVGQLRGHRVSVIDLPGLYSLEPVTEEEHAAYACLREQKIDVLINVADATALQRSLALTLQLCTLGIPMVLALNMIDEVRRSGGSVDVRALGQQLQMPVIPICAQTGEGVAELIRTALAEAGQKPQKQPAAEAGERYRKIEALCRTAERKPGSYTAGRRKTLWLDRLLLHRIWGIPLFFCMMAAVFYVTFVLAAPWLGGWMARGLGVLERLLFALLGQAHPFVRQLLLEGALPGVGAVLSFLPAIAVLFFFLAILEDSGYMARAAFLLDRTMRRMGLSGRAAVPLLMGFGCTVPAVMAVRTLPGRREKLQAVLMIPFIPCGAKLPVCLAAASLFFPQHRMAAVGLCYAGSVLAALLYGKLVQQAAPARSEGSFMLEMPPFRLPSPGSVLRRVAERAGEFVHRAFTLIFLFSVAVWALGYFDAALLPAPDGAHSILGLLGQRLAPLFKPLGFADWRIAAALLCGLGAKEAVLSTLQILPGGAVSMLPPAGAAAFLAFFMLYMPCMAAFAAIRREMNSFAAAAAAMLGQTAFAYVCALAVYRLAGIWLT